MSALAMSLQDSRTAQPRAQTNQWPQEGIENSAQFLRIPMNWFGIRMTYHELLRITTNH